MRCALRQVASIITVFGAAASEASPCIIRANTPASQTCRALVVARGIEGADKATDEGPTMAERRIPHPVAAGIPESCLVYGFVHCRTDDGKVFRTLNIFDEFSRECLTIRAQRKLNSADVSDALTDLFIIRGVPPSSAPTTARRSSPWPFGTGSLPSEPKRLTSSPDRLGRMAVRKFERPLSR